MAKKRKIKAGVKAWSKGADYHSAATLADVYHSDQFCRGGLRIRLRNLRRGKGGYTLCQDCKS
jgi:hypothetical protein